MPLLNEPFNLLTGITGFLKSLIGNPVLLSALGGWLVAQVIKMPIDYFLHKRWNWSLLFSAGGMPSSHSALVTGLAAGTAFFNGVNSTLFAITFILAMIVIYDATGIRRQAGIHAQKINMMINELLAGHPLSEDHLAEVLGHTPRQAFGGVLLGLISAIVVWAIAH